MSDGLFFQKIFGGKLIKLLADQEMPKVKRKRRGFYWKNRFDNGLRRRQRHYEINIPTELCR